MFWKSHPSVAAHLTAQVRAVGHRVVHGMHLHRPMLVTDDVIADIKRAAIFAPLHNPANAEGITAAQAVFGQSTPQARKHPCTVVTKTKAIIELMNPKIPNTKP